MKLIRKKLKLFSLLSALTMLLFSCSQYENDIEPIRDGTKSFYKEIYFGSVKSSKLNHVKDMI